MDAESVNQPPSPSSGHKPLGLSHVEWLALIRYQAREADQQSREPQPLAAMSLNGFQDAVEAMLSLICEHHQIPRQRRSDFDKLVDTVDAKFGDLHHHREPLIGLNTARVNFKHYGNSADRRPIERCRGNAMEFLIAASRVCFDQDFDAISMITLVRDPQARARLEAASAAWTSGKKKTAPQELRLAFDRLVRDYEQRKIEYPSKTPVNNAAVVHAPRTPRAARGRSRHTWSSGSRHSTSATG